MYFCLAHAVQVYQKLAHQADRARDEEAVKRQYGEEVRQYDAMRQGLLCPCVCCSHLFLATKQAVGSSADCGVSDVFPFA